MFPLIFDGTGWKKFLVQFLGILVKIWALIFFLICIDIFKKVNNYISQMKRQFFIIRLCSTVILMLLFILSPLCLTVFARKNIIFMRGGSAQRENCLG